VKAAYAAFMKDLDNARYVRFPVVFSKCINSTVDPIERQSYCSVVTMWALTAVHESGNADAQKFALAMARYDLGTSGLMVTPAQIENSLILPLEDCMAHTPGC
jgi:hypothetical protein